VPHAKIDVAFVREHFSDVEASRRAQAVGLYVALVAISGELLLDGQIPAAIVAAVGHDLGLKCVTRRHDRPSEVAILCHDLERSGVIACHQNGGLTVAGWQEHHNARAYVEERRKADADRKRGKRGQLTLGDETLVFHSGRPADVRSGQSEDSRARVRRRSASESKNISSSSVVSNPQDPTPDDDEDLLSDLETLGLSGHVTRAALDDPERAAAWIAYTAAHANGNHAGYFATSFTNGGWPPTTPPAPDPTERRARYVNGAGHLLPDDELDYQLAQMGADTDERIGLIEHAHDLRNANAPAST